MIKQTIITNISKEAKPWRDGLLYVTPDAQFFRKVNGGYVEAKKYLKNKNSQPQYFINYINKNNHWAEACAHNILTEVFIPKPEGGKAIKVKDGNFLNLSLDNLEWNISREYLREKIRKEKMQCRFKSLPAGFKKIPGRNAYITIDGIVAKPEKTGGFTIIPRRVQHNETTDVYTVTLYDHITQKSPSIGIHTLLAETFLQDQKKEDSRLVAFKDGNGLNISLDNLYWTTKINPIKDRKDVAERLTDVLPVECKFYDGVYVSTDGRVFSEYKGKYLEPKYYDDGENIYVYIPDPNIKNGYRMKKVKNLVAGAYIPKNNKNTKDLIFVDGNYKNISLSNITRRERVYFSTEMKDETYLPKPEEDVFDCFFHNLYVTKTANVYKKTQYGYKPVCVRQIKKPSGRIIPTISYYDEKRDKYEAIVLRKLIARAFLGHQESTEDVVTADETYNIDAIENIYIKEKDTDIYFLDSPAIKTCNEIPEGFVEVKYCDATFYINKDAEIYIKREDDYLHLVKYAVLKDKTPVEIYCRYLIYTDSAQPIHCYYFNVSAIYNLAFKDYDLGFYKVKRKLYIKEINSKKKRTSKRNPSNNKPGRPRGSGMEFVEQIPENYTKAKNCPYLWLNKEGDVYEYFPGKGYKKAKKYTQKKHDHPYVIIDYNKNEKNVYQHKGLDRLLAETFLWKEEGKCPYVLHKDGDYLNNSLDNLIFAGEEKRYKEKRKEERRRLKIERASEKTAEISVQNTRKEKIKYDYICTKYNYKDNKCNYITNLPVGCVPIPGKLYTNYYINPEGDVYRHYPNKGYVKLEKIVTEDGMPRVKIGSITGLQSLGLLLAKTFIPNPENLRQWETINGDPSDISLSNLRWKVCRITIDSLPEAARKTYHENIWADPEGNIYYEDKGSYIKVLKYNSLTTHSRKYTTVSVKGVHYYVSRLVAEAFLENPYGEEGVVEFINGDSQDVRVDNLQWTTKQIQSAKNVKKMHYSPVYCNECGKIRVFKGKKLCQKCQNKLNKSNKIKEEMALLCKIPRITEQQGKILVYYGQGMKASDIAKKLGISRQAVSQKLDALRRKASDSEIKYLDDGKITTYVKKKYKKLTTSVPFEEYEAIYKLALTKQSSAMRITSRVVRRIEKGITDGKTLEELVEMEDQLLQYQRASRHNG